MAVKLHINEPTIGIVDRTGYRFDGGGSPFTFDAQLGQRGSANLSLVVRAGDSYVPTTCAPVYLYDINTGAGSHIFGVADRVGPLLEWKSGFKFDQFEIGDRISIAASFYTISIIVDSTHLVFSSGAGTNIGAAFNSEFAIYGTCVYAGTIDTSEIKWLGDAGDKTVTLTCVSLERCFDTILVSPRSYIGQTAGFIVNDLLATACLGVPVTAGTIDTGPTIGIVVYDGTTSAWDALTALAALSSVTVGVDPARQQIYFTVPSAVSPFTLGNANVLYGMLDWAQTRADYRNRQLVQVALEAFAPSNWLFGGDGVTTAFTLPYPVAKVTRALLTSGSQATEVGTVATGRPADGDTITIGAAVYTWKDVLDNRISGQIQITAASGSAGRIANCQNLCDALNANPDTAGVAYSLPTHEGDPFIAVPNSPADASFTLTSKYTGSDWNGFVVSRTGTHFSWATGITSGGADGVSSGNLQIGTDGQSSPADLYYTVGSPVVNCAVPPSGSVILSVEFYRLGADLIAVEDSDAVRTLSAIENGTGRVQQVSTQSQTTDATAGYTLATAILAAYGELPVSLLIDTDTPGLLAGQQFTVSVTKPAGAGTLVNRTYLIQEISGSMVLVGDTRASGEHFRYTVKAINATIGNWVQFYQGLVGGGSGGSGGISSGGGQAATLGDFQVIISH